MKRGTIDHPKMRRLVRELGRVVASRSELGFVTIGGQVPLCLAVGILECLWHFAARHAPQGDIGRWSDADIADAVGWPASEAAGLVAGLVDSGWVDRHEHHRLVVHDWAEHADDAVNMSLARAKLFFADGRAPKTVRLGKEREAADAFYGSMAGAAATAVSREEIEAENRPDRADLTDETAKVVDRAHAVRTESAEKPTAIAIAIGINSLSTAREAFKAMHPDCRRQPDMAIENTLRAYPPDRWPEAIEAMGRHYAGDAPMRKPPLAILESYLARGPRERPAEAGPVKRGRKWEFKAAVPPVQGSVAGVQGLGSEERRGKSEGGEGKNHG